MILEQTSIGATVFARELDRWSAAVLIAGDTLDLPEIGIALPIDDCCAGLALPQTQPPSEGS